MGRRISGPAGDGTEGGILQDLPAPDQGRDWWFYGEDLQVRAGEVHVRTRDGHPSQVAGVLKVGREGGVSMDRCIFCQVEIPASEDNLCGGCRSTFGADVSASNYPGVVGFVDIALQDMKRQILPLVPGWRDSMGEPLKCQLKSSAVPASNSPEFEVEITIRFKEESDR